MKRFLAAMTVSAALVAGAGHAQTLEPQMSTQDITAQIEPNPSHLMVPILFIALVLASVSSATGGADGIIADAGSF